MYGLLSFNLDYLLEAVRKVDCTLSKILTAEKLVLQIGFRNRSAGDDPML